MMMLERLLTRAACGERLGDDEAFLLAERAEGRRAPLLEAAAAKRDRAWGRRVTFSPKVFLPLTNLCRSRCDYCSFRRSPGDPGEWTMHPDEVVTWLARASELSCCEALFCLGDKPDVFPAYRRLLRGWEFDDTVDYLVWAGEAALKRGLLPHTNAGVLSADQMARLKPVNVSLGLMLENVSPRLCQRGMPHQRAPDKRPGRRLAMTRQAGALRIPFTSGLLVGIGETLGERVETLLAIRALHEEHGHIQEVIVQNFRAGPETPMAAEREPEADVVAEAVALARLILDDEVSVQAPPNLNPASIEQLLAAGINDLGGISPLSIDYVNPGHPWPHLARLGETCAGLGFDLEPRLPVYDRYRERSGFLHKRLAEPVRTAAARLQALDPADRSAPPDAPAMPLRPSHLPPPAFTGDEP